MPQKAIIYAHMKLYSWSSSFFLSDNSFELQVQAAPKNRAALSLLGYAQYHRQDFAAAVTTYEALCKFHGDISEYRMLYAQCLYKAGDYEKAAQATVSIAEEQYKVIYVFTFLFLFLFINIVLSRHVSLNWLLLLSMKWTIWPVNNFRSDLSLILLEVLYHVILLICKYYY